MGFGFRTKFNARVAIETLRGRGTFSDAEADAADSYVAANGDIDRIKRKHEIRTSLGKQKQGDTKLIYVAGYYKEIQRKVEDHIIPFIQKTGMYSILR